MEVARARAEGDHEEEADARGQDEAYGAEEEGLREGADEGKDVADEVELGDLEGAPRPGRVSVGSGGGRGLLGVEEGGRGRTLVGRGRRRRMLPGIAWKTM